MKLFSDLFSTDYGLMSAGVLAFILGMAAWFGIFFRNKIAQEARDASKGPRP